MFRRIPIRTGSAIFYPRNTPSMIVNNIPPSTVIQMAVFQFGYQPVWVGYRRSLNGHFATVAKAISAPESYRSLEMVLASRYPWRDWV